MTETRAISCARIGQSSREQHTATKSWSSVSKLSEFCEIIYECLPFISVIRSAKCSALDTCQARKALEALR